MSKMLTIQVKICHADAKKKNNNKQKSRILQKITLIYSNALKCFGGDLHLVSS